MTDSLGNNPGALIGSGTATKGVSAPHGTGYDFELRSGFSIPPTAAVRPSDQFTITWWFKPTTLNAFDRMCESLAGTGNDGNGIRIDLGSSPGNKVRALLRNGNGSTNTNVTNPLVLSTGNWYFFALRYDSLLGECKVTVLQDTRRNISGSATTGATQTSTSLGTHAITHATGVFVAGHEGSAAGSNDFSGAMDDIAIFQTGDTFGVLTDAELAEAYNGGALAFDHPAPRPTINSFSADSTSVSNGQLVTLSWDVALADTIEITPGFVVSGATGSVIFNASATKIYIPTSTNAEGSVSQNLQITVVDPTKWMSLSWPNSRWGDYRVHVQAASNWSQSDYDLYARDDHYFPNQTWITGTYLQQGPAIVLQQLRDRNLYPDVDAPGYGQVGAVLGTVVVPRNLAADDVIVTVQTSIDLINWTDLTEVLDQTFPAAGFSSQTYAVDPGGSERFFRVGMQLR